MKNEITTSLEEKIKRIRGPILILGASGFIGANLFKTLLRYRLDVYGTVFHRPAWRLEGIPNDKVLQSDLLVDTNLDSLFKNLDPKVVFNCVSYGSYSFEHDSEIIYQTNFILTAKILNRLAQREIVCYVHSGSSTEYGDQNSVPLQDELPDLNSEYAVSKVATANLINFFGRKKNLPCANLRLHTVYGPLEDASMLISRVVRLGEERQFPELPTPEITYDFVYIDDVIQANIKALQSKRGGVFNVGSGAAYTFNQVVAELNRALKTNLEPDYFENPYSFTQDWTEADLAESRRCMGYEPQYNLAKGIDAYFASGKLGLSI